MNRWKQVFGLWFGWSIVGCLIVIGIVMGIKDTSRQVIVSSKETRAAVLRDATINIILDTLSVLDDRLDALEAKAAEWPLKDFDYSDTVGTTTLTIISGYPPTPAESLPEETP